jgi:hypothetical protein
VQSQASPPRLAQIGAFFRRIPGWTWALVAGLATVLSLLTGYPWLAIDEGGRLDERNPYSALFSVRNDGYLPVADLDADCQVSSARVGGLGFNNIHSSQEHFATFLSHSRKATLPCFRAFYLRGDAPPFSVAGDLTNRVTYALWPFSFHVLRRHQDFHFKATSSPDGQMYWTYVS